MTTQTRYRSAAIAAAEAHEARRAGRLAARTPAPRANDRAGALPPLPGPPTVTAADLAAHDLARFLAQYQRPTTHAA